MKFTARIDINGVNPYVLVSQEIANTLKPQWRRPIPVIIQVNGKPNPPWHINMVPVGDGSFYLYLHESVRKASQTRVGDTVDVEITFDTTYHNGPLTEAPEWFSAALVVNTIAQRHWQALSPSRQKEVIRNFVGLKSQEAKDRNLEKALYVLSGKPGHFMGRDWKNGK